MDYLTTQEAAERWNVTQRWVQQCCKRDAIPGATRLGRSWMVPAEALPPVPQRAETEPGDGAARPKRSYVCESPFMPLVATSFLPGEAEAFAASVTAMPSVLGTDASPSSADEKNALVRAIATAELAYFRGEADACARTLEGLLESPDPSAMLSANLMFAFANLTLDRIAVARASVARIQQMTVGAQDGFSRTTAALCVYMASVLLHLEQAKPAQGGLPPIDDCLRMLPGGLKMYAYYVAAHLFYLKGEYGRSLGLAEAALSMQPAVYPISAIYLHLVCSMNLMSMRRAAEARSHFMAAWELALPDRLFESFGEHHGLLQGLVETCLKDSHPQEYKTCIGITYRFSKGWRMVHNPTAHEEVADVLSTTEFSISMLASRGWSNREIAEHMGISADAVKHHLSLVYAKLNVKNRKQLSRYMLR